MYSPKEAADAVGLSKSAILRAIKSGKISASRDANDHYQIDPAELHRVYPKKPAKAASPEPKAKRSDTASGSAMERVKLQLEHLESRLANQKEERERERRQAQETIDDLRARLDREAEQRNALQNRLLTDERLSAKRGGLFGLGKKRAS